MSTGSVTIPVRWDGEQPPAQPVNQFVVMNSPSGEVLLVFGHVFPIVAGTPEQQQAQANELVGQGGLRAKIVAKLVLTAPTARNLHQVLSEQLGIKVGAS